MFLAQITNAALTQGSAIGLSNQPTLSTNSNVKLNSSNNGLYIVNPGIYKVRMQLVATAGSSGTALGAQLYANGQAVDMTAVTVTVANSASAEIVIEYPVKVVSSDSSTNALVQFYALQAATAASGYVSVERIS